MLDIPDDSTLADIESHAADIARGAGAILSGYFGKSLTVEYKDEQERDPVSTADKESQRYLVQAIADRFPHHSVVAEEDQEVEDAPAQDFVWVLDPLDGTKNFLGGLPVYACSVGVMYRGVPVAGATFVPWPCDGGGTVLHARKSGGAFMDQKPISVSEADEPRSNSLVTLPASFGSRYGFGKPMRGKVGEVRVTGSIAYELAMTAKGVVQYSVTTGPSLWDVAAGAMLVMEAGGLAMRGYKRRGLKSLLTSTRWEAVESLVPSWQSNRPTLKELHRWSAPMVFGSPGIVRYVTANMKTRRLLRYRLRRRSGPPPRRG